DHESAASRLGGRSVAAESYLAYQQPVLAVADGTVEKARWTACPTTLTCRTHHFQVMTWPTFFPTDSPTYVFDRFEHIGQVTERIWDDIIGLQPTGTLPYMHAPNAGPRTARCRSIAMSFA
ncbi:MAG: hypothetical protein J2P17_28745, partial [Mycobacterium sp.]|nr:hypothetical protein [Mycobacterium sp.]